MITINKKFDELPEEKRIKIINAAMEVFAKNDYKHAITDEIAAKAGISKGLLFFYFYNKITLHTYLFDYAKEFLENEVIDTSYLEMTDFFEVLDYAAKRKMEIYAKYPYIMDFLYRIYLSGDKEISARVQERTQQTINHMKDEYFRNIDFTKFKDDIDVTGIVNMLTWMTQGYLYTKNKEGKPLDLKEMWKDYQIWSDMLKKMSYKEEMLDGCH